MKPLQKLTGTDGQADRQTGKPMCREAAPPKMGMIAKKLDLIILKITKLEQFFNESFAWRGWRVASYRVKIKAKPN